MLGISRPTLVRLLEEGKIPYTQANRHRRVFLRDVVEYQERHRVFARETLADVRAEAASLGEYDQDFDDMQEVARWIRKERRGGVFWHFATPGVARRIYFIGHVNRELVIHPQSRGSIRIWT